MIEARLLFYPFKVCGHGSLKSLGYSVFCISANSETKGQSVLWQIPSFFVTGVTVNLATLENNTRNFSWRPLEAIKPKSNSFPNL